jgi:hypothetical protein
MTRRYDPRWLDNGLAPPGLAPGQVVLDPEQSLHDCDTTYQLLCWYQRRGPNALLHHLIAQEDRIRPHNDDHLSDIPPWRHLTDPEEVHRPSAPVGLPLLLEVGMIAGMEGLVVVLIGHFCKWY